MPFEYKEDKDSEFLSRDDVLEINETHKQLRDKINELKTHKKVVVTSGYFDPLHHGHVELFKLSKQLGDYLIVVINNDTQTKKKKGYVFMSDIEKAKIISEFKCVDEVFISIDKEQPQINTLDYLRPHIFAKGGDRYINEIPETPICRKNGIQIIDGVGAKVQSSSDLVSQAEKSKQQFTVTKQDKEKIQ